MRLLKLLVSFSLRCLTGIVCRTSAIREGGEIATISSFLLEEEEGTWSKELGLSARGAMDWDPLKCPTKHSSTGGSNVALKPLWSFTRRSTVLCY